MIRKFSHTAKISAVIYACIFGLLLLCNVLSLFIADDYRYLYSFDGFTRIETVGQIIPSMQAHAKIMNGRLVAHSLVQLFGLMPMWVFDIVNSLVFTLQITLIYKIGVGSQKCNNILLASIFCVLWLVEPVFGRVNLWQDGAVNYLWSILFGLIFILPFVNMFVYNKKMKTGIEKLLFLILAFLVGAYSETVSIAVVFMGILLVALNVFYKKRRLDFYWIGVIFVGFLGYISIYLAPAQWGNKGAQFSIMVLVENFAVAGYVYLKHFGILLCTFLGLLIWSIFAKKEWDRILLALVFFSGSMVANFIMMFAKYYPDNCTVGAFVFLLIADVMLVYPMLESKKYKKFLTCVLLILMLATIPALISGMQGITETYAHMKKNEDYIYECRENGIRDVEVPMFSTSSEYSIAFGAKYLDTENVNSWPNDAMTRYYKVRSIIGVEVE